MRKIKGRRVLAVDLPGHGRSDGSACQTSAQYAACLDSLLKSAKIFGAIFVGYSLGGQIVLRYALDHPDQCAGLGLIACSTEPAVPPGLLDLLDDSSAAPVISELVRSLEFTPNTPPLKLKEMEKVLFSARRGTLAADWRAFKNFYFPNLDEALRGTPLWVCAARGDRLIPALSARLLASHHPAAKSTFIDHCGHALLAEQPEKVSHAFQEWLASL